MEPEKMTSSPVNSTTDATPVKDEQQEVTYLLEIPIIKRNRIDKSAVFYGGIALGILLYTLPAFLMGAEIPIIDPIIDQVGLHSFRIWLVLVLLCFGTWLSARMIYTVVLPKVKEEGFVRFSENSIQVKKAKQLYQAFYSDIPYLEH